MRQPIVKSCLVLLAGSVLALTIAGCGKSTTTPEETAPRKSLGLVDDETARELREAVEATGDALGKAASQVVSNVAEELQIAADQLADKSDEWSEQVAARTRQAAEDIADYAEDFGEELTKEADTAVVAAAKELRIAAARAEGALENLENEAPARIDSALHETTDALDEVVAALEKASEAWAERLSGEVVEGMETAASRLKEISDSLEKSTTETAPASESE